MSEQQNVNNCDSAQLPITTKERIDKKNANNYRIPMRVRKFDRVHERQRFSIAQLS